MKTLEQVSMISDEDKDLLHEIKILILEFLPDAEIFLYGSVARGMNSHESDYDLLILTDKPLANKKKERIEQSILNLELKQEVILSTAYHTQKEWDYREIMPLHIEVEKEGVLL